jgi:acyl-CoA thioester hydrolase
MTRSRHAQRGSSAPDAFAIWVPVAVRYSDLDQQGHANNAVYFTYFEQARLGYFDAVRRLARAAQTSPPGHSSADASSRGVADAREFPVAPGATDDRLELPLVVSEASCTYLRPIASLTPVAIGVRAARIGHASLVLEYALRLGTGDPLYATGSTTIVCVDPVTGRPRGLPQWTLAALRQLEAGASRSAPPEPVS